MLTGPILLQLIVILIVVQIVGHLCRRIGQQWVIGEILAGLALGPSLLGALFPGVMGFLFPASALSTLQTLGDIGLILYMFSLGARLDINIMLNQKRTAVLTSAVGILLPMLLGMGLAFWLFPGLAGAKANLISFMLLVGTIMAITAFPVLARILTERQMLGTRLGTLALTCAAIDDVVAWCLLALVVAVIHATGVVSAISTLGLTLIFILCVLLLVRPLLAAATRRLTSKPLLIAFCMVLVLLASFYTNGIGIHPIFGAFLMGVILPRKPVFTELVRNIDQINGVLFLPLFFVYSGLRTQIGLISNPWLWLLCLLILVIACFGKIVGAMSAMRVMGESWKDAIGLGLLMNTRGLVELIMLNIGLDLGVLSPTLFAMLVIMALIATMMPSPILPLLGYKQTRPQERNEPLMDAEVAESPS